MDAVPTLGIIFGALIGFALGGVYGFGLGLVIGGAFEYLCQAIYRKLPRRLFAHGFEEVFWSRTAFSSRYPEEVIVLAAKLAKVDGHISRAEIDAFKRIFQISPGEVRRLGRIFNAAGRSAEGFATPARLVRQYFIHEPAQLEVLLHAYFAMAASEGPLVPKQIAFLREVAYWFGLGDEVWARVSRRYLGAAGRSRAEGADIPGTLTATPEIYALLGVEASDSDSDIKARHKRLVRELHPDQLSAQGKSSAEIAAANKRLAAINAAYDEIKRQRGLR